MLSRFLRLLVLSLILLSLASPGFAARRSSLGGNLLIKDMDDIFFLPQRVVDYNRTLAFDYGSSNGLGSGGMIFGSESMTFGAFAHRSDFLGAIPNAFNTIGDIMTLSNDGQNDLGGSLGSAGPAGGPYNWIDVLFGFMGGENPMGIRLSVGRAQDDTTPAGGTEDKSNVTSVDVVFGVSINDIDMSAEVAFATAKDEVGADKTESSPVGFAVMARKTAMDESEDLVLGWLGSFQYLTGGADVSGATTVDNKITDLGFTAGVGPVYMPTDRTVVAMYGTFEYMNSTDETTTGGATTKTTDVDYVIPGWRIAGEVEIASWLQWRGGLVSRYVISQDKDEDAGGEDKFNESFLEYSWHTGLGFTLGDFMLDTYIHPDVITSGTDLLGNSSDVFGMASVRYGF